jgi:hypothetical protein
MKKIILWVFVGITLFALAGCTSVTPLAATSNPLGTKVGQASVFYLFSSIPIPFSGDRGIAKAARNGGITLISTVDTKIVVWPFGIGTTRTTIVTGE